MTKENNYTPDILACLRKAGLEPTEHMVEAEKYKKAFLVDKSSYRLEGSVYEQVLRLEYIVCK